MSRLLMHIGAAVTVLGIIGGCTRSTAADSDGADLFARYCASCHGTYGEGDGPVAAVMTGAIPNLRSLAARNGGEFPREPVIRYIDGRDLPAAHGERMMPVWGDTLSNAADTAEDRSASEQISAIADFIEQLQN